jgi:hypothetical protein
MKSVYLFLLTVIALAVPSFAAPIQWAGNGHWYEWVTEQRSWADQNALAQARGGYLVSITSEGEQDWLFATFGGGYWIGFTDEAEEGTWAWTTGEPTSYTNWLDGEPNNEFGYEHAAHMLDGGKWNDYWADADNRAVFEWNAEPVPEPGAILLTGAGIVALLDARLRRRRV